MVNDKTPSEYSEDVDAGSLMNLDLPESTADRSAGTTLSARSVFYYGWVMAPISTIAAICSVPGQSVGVAAFNEAIRHDLDLSTSQFSGAYALGTICAAFLLPITGAVMDRAGIRVTMFVVVLMLAAACGFTSYVSGLALLFLAFFCLRLFGQGSLSLLAANTMAMWFDRRLGTIHGISAVIITTAMGFAPLLLGVGIESVGWRMTYRYLGMAVLGIMLPLLWMYRNRPEDVGQQMDGDELPDLSPALASRAVNDVEFAAAIRLPNYWILLAVVTTWSMTCTAMIFDVQPLARFKEANLFPPTSACTIFFVCVAIMTFCGGFLVDRFPIHRLLSLALLGNIVGLVFLLLFRSHWFFVAYAIYGIAQGLLLAVGNTIWVRYFGRKHIGKIRGGSTTAMVAGSSLGPLASGVGYDLTGSYTLPFCLFLAATVLTFIGSLLLRPPESAGQLA